VEAGDQPPTQASVASEDADNLWESIQETLRRGGYRLDRVDREAGIVTTLPETSQHFFEVWRRDVNTRADFWEATFNPIRRWVEVRVSTVDGGANELSVIVRKERLSSLDRQFNSTGAAYRYFGESLPSTTGKVKITAEDDHWIDRGHDPAMEQYFLTAILKRACVLPG
jgi:hypothetical protein